MILRYILWDFYQLWMQFKVGESKYTLKVLKEGLLQLINLHHMEKFLNKCDNQVMEKLFSIHPSMQEFREV